MKYLTQITLCVILMSVCGGCGGHLQGGASPKSARLVTFAELEQATKHQSHIEYLGKDEAKAFFHAPDQGYFSVEVDWTSLLPLRGPFKAGESKSPILMRIENSEPKLVEVVRRSGTALDEK
jgi:hypothetical protein